MSNQFHKLYYPYVVDDINNISVLELAIKKLIEHSAHQIIIHDKLSVKKIDTKEHTYNSTIMSTKDYIESFPPMFKKRIKIISATQSYHKLDDFLSPITHINIPKNIALYNQPVFFYLGSIGINLQSIYLGSIHECTSFTAVPPPMFVEAFEIIEKYITTKEQLERVAFIKSIFGMYKQIELDRVYISNNDFISMKHRLDDILDDAQIIKISKKKYCLGIPSSMKKSLIWLKKNIRYIFEDNAYKKYFSWGKSLVNLGLKQNKIPIELPDFNIYHQKFSPPIIRQDEFQDKIIREILSPKDYRTYWKILKINSMVSAEFPFTNTKEHELLF